MRNVLSGCFLLMLGCNSPQGRSIFLKPGPIDSIPFTISDSEAAGLKEWSIDWRQKDYLFVTHWPAGDTLWKKFIVVKDDTDVIKFKIESNQRIFSSREPYATKDSNEIKEFISNIRLFYKLQVNSIQWVPQSKLTYFMNEKGTIVYQQDESTSIDSLIIYAKRTLIKHRWYKLER